MTMAYIPLSNCEDFVVVDLEDVPNLLDKTWWVGGDGYVTGVLPRNGKKQQNVKMHRILTAAQKGFAVDHVNGDKLDNRKSNLRLCKNAENLKNCKLYKSNSSGFKGVAKNGKSKWRAYARDNGVLRHLGNFETKEDAATAYNFAIAEWYGEFAKYNTVSQPWLEDT